MWVYKTGTISISDSPSYNLNIPVQNGKDRVPPSSSARSLVESFDTLIQELCDSFAKFLCCYSTRVKLYEYSSEVKLKVSVLCNTCQFLVGDVIRSL